MTKSAMSEKYSIEKNKRPPRFVVRFLQWFCPSHLFEGVYGDLLERFDEECKGAGEKMARWRFVWNVIRFFRPGVLIRHSWSNPLQRLYALFDLLGSYLIVSWRNISRFKTISLINIVGLSVSMSVGLLILMVIKNNLEYDTFHPDKDRLFRITTHVAKKSAGHLDYASSPLPLGRFLKDNYSFIEETLTIIPSLRGTVRTTMGELYFRGAFADASFFDMTGFRLLSGNLSRALSDPYSIVITEETAQKLFGRVNPLGETLTVEGYGDFRVSGIISKPDSPSHIEFEAYASMASLAGVDRHEAWGIDDVWKTYTTSYTYVKIKPGAKPPALDRALTETGVRRAPEMSLADPETKLSFRAQAIDDIPLSPLLLDPGGGRSIESIMTLSIPAVILLLLAVFNYTNMAIARGFSRAKETGLRKVVGASRSQVFFQFVVESVVLAVLSLGIASLLTGVIPVNASFEQSMPDSFDPLLLVWFFIFAIAVGCIAGFFPALALAKAKPVQALKNFGDNSAKKQSWKKGMIITQFSVTLAFLIVLIVSHKQMQFQVGSDYGFARKDILHIKPGPVNSLVLQREIEQQSGVKWVSASSHTIFSWGYLSDVKFRNDSSSLEYYFVDDKFIPAYELELLAGDNFSSDQQGNHEHQIILNQKAVDVLNLGTPHEALGYVVVINDTLRLRVAGVMANFNAHPFKHPVSPLGLRYKPDEFRVLTVRTESSSMQAVLDRISMSWEKIEPDYPLSLSIFEEQFNTQQAHVDDMKMMGFVALIAIIISCLGLLGVVMHNTQSRKKEIGIRKVMGANTYEVLVLLTWNFLRLLLIAACLAVPVGYWLADLVLQQFVFRVEVGVEVISLGFLIMMALGLLTVCSQTVGAARRNPVDILKYE